VLLTGATGFIGRRIQQVLLTAGIPVRIIVRPGSRHRHHADPRCEVFACDLSDAEALSHALTAISAIVYCAGSVRGRNLQDFLPANVAGVRSMVQAQTSLASPVPFLLISSLAASRPEISDYARSKYLGEEVVRLHASSPWTILRPPAVYGPGDTEMAPILKMARRGLAFRPGPENQRLSLLHADDLAGAVMAWLNHWQECTNLTFTIDDGREGGYDWPTIMQASGTTRFRIISVPYALLAGIARFNLVLSGMLGYAPMLTPGKVRELTQACWLCDNTAFTRVTGWQPQTDLASGMRLAAC
jgi:nucleoside-diphosphate-sugar epimerase